MPHPSSLQGHRPTPSLGRNDCVHATLPQRDTDIPASGIYRNRATKTSWPAMLGDMPGKEHSQQKILGRVLRYRKAFAADLISCQLKYWKAVPSIPSGRGRHMAWFQTVRTLCQEGPSRYMGKAPSLQSSVRCDFPSSQLRF